MSLLRRALSLFWILLFWSPSSSTLAAECEAIERIGREMDMISSLKRSLPETLEHTPILRERSRLLLDNHERELERLFERTLTEDPLTHQLQQTINRNIDALGEHRRILGSVLQSGHDLVTVREAAQRMGSDHPNHKLVLSGLIAEEHRLAGLVDNLANQNQIDRGQIAQRLERWRSLTETPGLGLGQGLNKTERSLIETLEQSIHTQPDPLAVAESIQTLLELKGSTLNARLIQSIQQYRRNPNDLPTPKAQFEALEKNLASYKRVLIDLDDLNSTKVHSPLFKEHIDSLAAKAQNPRQSIHEVEKSIEELIDFQRQFNIGMPSIPSHWTHVGIKGRLPEPKIDSADWIQLRETVREQHAGYGDTFDFLERHWDRIKPHLLRPGRDPLPDSDPEVFQQLGRLPGVFRPHYHKNPGSGGQSSVGFFSIDSRNRLINRDDLCRLLIWKDASGNFLFAFADPHIGGAAHATNTCLR
jgi:hypothetical protein